METLLSAEVIMYLECGNRIPEQDHENVFIMLQSAWNSG